jgi:hypothetical protein
MSDLEAIVRALAAANPVYNPVPDSCEDAQECALCHVELAMTYYPYGKTANAYTARNPHDAGCPWRLARELVEREQP